MEDKYNETINKLSEDFNKSLEQDEYSNELTEKFKQYLINTVKQTQEDSAFKVSDENIINSILQRAGGRLINSPIEYKKQALLEDDSMDAIRRISNKIYGMAIDAIEGKAESEAIKDMKSIREKLQNLGQQVKPWNQNQAKQLISETIIELDVIENPKTEILSLRLGHIYGNKRREEEER